MESVTGVKHVHARTNKQISRHGQRQMDTHTHTHSIHVRTIIVDAEHRHLPGTARRWDLWCDAKPCGRDAAEGCEDKEVALHRGDSDVDVGVTFELADV